MSNLNRELIDSVSLGSGLGVSSSSTVNAFKGFNHRGVGSPIKMNTDNHGMTFFTRPCLNLSYDNLALERKLSFLLNSPSNTLSAAIRVLLDPWRANSVGVSYKERLDDLKNPNNLVDPLNPFMPILSNNLLSISGWPDPNMEVETSSEGLYKEQHSMADGHAENYGAFNLTANFRNIEGDPINTLFEVWRIYMAKVKKGHMVPYPDMVVENELDYMTRIYRLILDPTRTYVQKISACGAAFPTANQLAASFNYASDQAMDQTNAQISIPFQCMGAEYNDPISFREFNAVVGMFNTAMQPSKLLDPAQTSMVKIKKEELGIFNWHGYPRIADDGELQWWMPRAQYEAILSTYNLDIRLPSNLKGERDA